MLRMMIVVVGVGGFGEANAQCVDDREGLCCVSPESVNLRISADRVSDIGTALQIAAETRSQTGMMNFPRIDTQTQLCTIRQQIRLK